MLSILQFAFSSHDAPNLLALHFDTACVHLSARCKIDTSGSQSVALAGTKLSHSPVWTTLSRVPCRLSTGIKYRFPCFVAGDIHCPCLVWVRLLHCLVQAFATSQRYSASDLLLRFHKSSFILYNAFPVFVKIYFERNCDFILPHTYLIQPPNIHDICLATHYGLNLLLIWIARKTC